MPREVDGKKISAGKELTRLIFSHWRKLILIAFLLLFATAASVLGPYILKLVIDRGIMPRNPQNVARFAFLFLGVSAAEFIFRYLQSYKAQSLGQKVSFDLRKRVFSHLLRLPVSFYEKRKSGEIATKISQDIELINSLFSSGFLTILGDAAFLTGAAVMMVLLSPSLALYVAFIIPVIFLVIYVFRKKLRQGYRKVRKNQAELNGFISETVPFIPFLASYGRSGWLGSEFESRNKNLESSFLKTVTNHALFVPSLEVSMALVVVVVILKGAVGIASGSVTVGILVAFIGYLSKSLGPIRDISEKFNLWQFVNASADEVFSLLEIEEESGPGRCETSVKEGSIEIKDLNFSYEEKSGPALRGVNLSVKPGEKIALVGATGSGKTTLVKLLLGLYETPENSVLIDGKDVNSFNKEKLRRNFGVILQDSSIFTGKLKEHIYGEWVERRENSAKKMDLAKLLEPHDIDPEHEITESAANLSAGQKQLVSFARVLAQDPKIIILDEATSNVDVSTEKLLQEAFEKVSRGKTAIIIAHRFTTLKNVDRIHVVHKGQIKETGTFSQLIRNGGIFSRLYELQKAESKNEKDGGA